MYCPHCGAETENIIPVAPAVTETVNAEVEIARIQAARDVEVAKIQARQDKDWNETRVEVAEVEAAAEVASAEATAEVVAAVIDANGDEPPAEPAVIDVTGAMVEDAPEDAPPEVEGSVPPAAKGKSAGLGFW